MRQGAHDLEERLQLFDHLRDPPRPFERRERLQLRDLNNFQHHEPERQEQAMDYNYFQPEQAGTHAEALRLMDQNLIQNQQPAGREDGSQMLVQNLNRGHQFARQENYPLADPVYYYGNAPHGIIPRPIEAKNNEEIALPVRFGRELSFYNQEQI